ncbi:hypothetical protein [Yersinia rochesterensis]|uniref:hypothetical protein n=1 Tax=Yersinia rochesterensis TaxID=1604335 RepID=UPI00119D45DD|nr:hypothetical protein [Yersinia rochesterensis]
MTIEKELNINTGNQGYQPIDKGYQPIAADSESDTTGVRGGYQPSSAGENPANKPLPPSED